MTDAARGCVVLLSHQLDPTTRSRLAELRRALSATHDVVLTLTEALGEQAAQFGIADVEVLTHDEIFLPDYGAKSDSRAIVPGNSDLALLAFARRHPGYGPIWIVEYDVMFHGGAELLGTLDAASSAELIVSTKLRNRVETPDWFWWPSLQFAPSEPRGGPRGHALLCLARYGAQLRLELDTAYRAGWNGHFEAVVPTLARRRNLPIESLNEIALRSLGERVLEPASFHHARCRPSPIARIYHPVKTPQAEAVLRRGIQHQTTEG